MDVAYIIWICMIISECIAGKHESPKIKEFSFSPRVAVGDQASAFCFVGSTDSTPEFTWLKDGKPVESYRNVSIKVDKEFSVIILNPVSVASSGNYTCLAKTKWGQASYSAFLTVVAPPRWLIEPTNLTVVVGDPVSLTCVAEGSPKPVINWRRTDKNLTTGHNVPFTTQDGILKWNSIKIDDDGEYECSAENGASQPLSKRISVKCLLNGDTLEALPFADLVRFPDIPSYPSSSTIDGRHYHENFDAQFPNQMKAHGLHLIRNSGI
ncbi:cell adhesion molecule Dscam2-like [Uloborus diversus]|uniref:cell adhesion molecule Dscam2-like n=1 Tax=Uloborus diversus TaxID=327109 RepID=UPI00240925FC|nr:cell adhesion molecule Dscam2-like [Uloborus diversus]